MLVLRCCHATCAACLRQWLSAAAPARPACPFCRAPAPSADELGALLDEPGA